jgi:glycosyltransferase involved in cell wall biosynthesis
MHSPRVYFIIPTDNIGGAEKRFIELWQYLLQAGNSNRYNLVISKQLLANNNNTAVINSLDTCPAQVHVYDIGHAIGIYAFQKKLYQFVCSISSRADVLHFIIAYPSLIFNIRHKKTIYTLTESSLKNANIKGKISYLLNVLRAKKADVLDPLIHTQLSALFFFKKKSICLTPGSFVDYTVFTPLPWRDKKNQLVFLGRFFAMKQVISLLKAVPVIYKRLIDENIQGCEFIFIGYGPLQQQMNEILHTEAFKNLPVKIIQTNEPQQILNQSKIFFSVQLNNNYPSKSLMEAMASGNIPVVTDVGTTRNLAHPHFSFYVPEQFTANDVADAVINIYKEGENQQQQKAEMARQFIINNYSIAASAAYYENLYNSFT